MLKSILNSSTLEINLIDAYNINRMERALICSIVATLTLITNIGQNLVYFRCILTGAEPCRKNTCVDTQKVSQKSKRHINYPHFFPHCLKKTVYNAII